MHFLSVSTASPMCAHLSHGWDLHAGSVTNWYPAFFDASTRNGVMGSIVYRKIWREFRKWLNSQFYVAKRSVIKFSLR